MRLASLLEDYKWAFRTLNNLYDIERKLRTNGNPGNAIRNVEQIKEQFMDTWKLFYEDPAGQKVNETRADLEASITGSRTDNLTVVEVIKPILRNGDRNYSRVVQKGVVVLESESEREI